MSDTGRQWPDVRHEPTDPITQNKHSLIWVIPEELILVRNQSIRTESWPNSSNAYAVLNQDSGKI